PPLVAWILAGVFGILGRIGRDALAMKLVFAALSAALVPVAARAYREMLPAGWSTLASVLLFFSTGLLIVGTGFHTEAIYPALLLGAVWLLFRQRSCLGWRA